MNKLENAFFEEYKALDKVMKDFCQSDKGVSSYIEMMEKRNLDTSCKKDYDALKHVRWLRNKLAHSDEVPEVKEEDLNYLVTFHDKVVRMKDPISLAKARSQKKKAEEDKRQKESGNKMLFWFVLLMALVIVILLIV